MKDFEKFIKERLDWTLEQKKLHKNNPYWVGQYETMVAIVNNYEIMVKDRPF